MHEPKWVVPVLLAAAVAASPARAQESGTGEEKSAEATLAELRKAYETDPDPELLYEMGKLLYELERDDEAEVELLAYMEQVEHLTELRKMEVQSILYEILISEHPLYKKAKHHIAVKKYVLARETLIEYLEVEGDSMSEVRRDQIQALLAEVEAQISEVTFSCNVPEATVYMSGVFVGTIPLGKPLLLDAGEYPVEVGAGGFRTAKKVVTVTQGEDKHLKIMLTREESEWTCKDVTCSGRGTCIISSGFPQCLCEEGYQSSSSGLECERVEVEVPLTRSAATASIVLSSVGAAGMVAGPILATHDGGSLGAGLGVTITSFLIVTAGVPLGIETLARYATQYRVAAMRSTYIGARAWAIAGSTAGSGLLVSGMVLGNLPLLIVGMAHFLALAGTGIALSASAIVAMKNREKMQPELGLRILPAFVAIPGGATVGVTGRF